MFFLRIIKLKTIEENIQLINKGKIIFIIREKINNFLNNNTPAPDKRLKETKLFTKTNLTCKNLAMKIKFHSNTTLR